ncbi:MAG: hypothetical protein SAK29_40985, partial [Scytonema sp. PMC 1069.18]|nr:hypothetical protein [Scytonema sp. PMC 1069.18]
IVIYIFCVGVFLDFSLHVAIFGRFVKLVNPTNPVSTLREAALWATMRYRVSLLWFFLTNLLSFTSRTSIKNRVGVQIISSPKAQYIVHQTWFFAES